MTNKILNKQLLKKWWFWVIVVVLLVAIGQAMQEAPTNTTNTDNTNSSQTTGTLPALDKNDYLDKESLVVFKELTTKGYSVTAKYVNEKLPATNQELTEPFNSADINSCEDRLGWDAYVISDLTQSGDSVSLVATIKPNSNQECPAGTVNDLN